MQHLELGAGKKRAKTKPQTALTRPIRWELIEQNYDQMMEYATAIKQGTASTEAILRRFTESASHPVYQAMLWSAARGQDHLRRPRPVPAQPAVHNQKG